MWDMQPKHLHAHVPGLPLAQIFLRTHNLEVAERVPMFLPKLLDVLLMKNLLQKEPTVKDRGPRVGVNNVNYS